MMVNVLMSLGEYERLVIAERTRDKMAASKKRGIWMGGYVPYGFFVKDKKLYAHPEEAPVVRRIFSVSRKSSRRNRLPTNSMKTESDHGLENCGLRHIFHGFWQTIPISEKFCSKVK